MFIGSGIHFSESDFFLKHLMNLTHQGKMNITTKKRRGKLVWLTKRIDKDGRFW